MHVKAFGTYAGNQLLRPWTSPAARRARTVGKSTSPLQRVPFRYSSGPLGIGGIPETQEMLDFCAQHDIVDDIEMIRAG